MALFRRATNEDVEEHFDDSDDMFNLLPSWSKQNTGAYGAVRLAANAGGTGNLAAAKAGKGTGTSAASASGASAASVPPPGYSPAPWTIQPKPSAASPSKPPIPSFSGIKPSAPRPPSQASVPRPPSQASVPRPPSQASVPHTSVPQTPSQASVPQPPAAPHQSAAASSGAQHFAEEAPMPAARTGQDVPPSFQTMRPDTSSAQPVVSEPFFLEDDYDDYEHDVADYDSGNHEDGDDDDDGNFYDANSGRKARFLGPAIFIAVALLCVGAGAFYVMQSGSKNTSSPDNTADLSSASAPETPSSVAADQAVPSTAAPTTAAPSTTKPAATTPKAAPTTAPKASTPTTAPAPSGPKPGQVCNIYSDGRTVGCEGFDLSQETMPIRVKLANGKTITCAFNDTACRSRTE